MNYKHSLLIAAIGILIILPTLTPLFNQQFFQMHDFTHVARLAELDTALRDGHFPVRWSRNLGYGYGMPHFTFYAPLPYYVAEVAHLLGTSAINSIKIVFFLNFFISFLGMYVLAKEIWGKTAGLIAATAFIYAPYRAVDFYVRGALGELTAITFIPMTLACMIILTKKVKPIWIVPTSISFAAILLSHNLISLITIPVVFLFSIVLSLVSSPNHRLKTLIFLITSLGLGFGLAAFYVGPAFLEKSFTRVDVLTSGYSHYSQHFLYLRQLWQSAWGYGGSIFGLEDDISFEIGKLHLILAAIGITSLITFIQKKHRLPFITILTSTFVLAASMLMTSFKSSFVWDNLSPLSYVQFPWRFLSLIIVFVSFLSGGVAAYLSKIKPTPRIIISVSIIASFMLLNHNLFKPKEFLENNAALYYEDPNRIQTEMSGIIPDFIPPNIDTKDIVPQKNRFILGTQPITAQVDRTHEFAVLVNSTQPETFGANIFYFPGWKIFADGSEVPVQVHEKTATFSAVINPTNSNGVLISGKLTETPLRKAVNMITILTIISLVYLATHEHIANRTRKR